MNINDYIKFSSVINGKNYFTIIDLQREYIKVMENGITVFDDKLKRFKKTVAEGGWLHNNIYESILKNAEELINLLSKA